MDQIELQHAYGESIADRLPNRSQND